MKIAKIQKKIKWKDSQFKIRAILMRTKKTFIRKA